MCACPIPAARCLPALQVDEYKKDKYKKETDEYKEYVNNKKKYVENKKDKYHKDDRYGLHGGCLLLRTPADLCNPDWLRFGMSQLCV
jgi:hypothetical protein